MDSVAGMLQSWKGSAATFLAWWRDELWGLVPEQVRVHLASGETSLVVATGPTGLQVLEEAGGKVSAVSPVLVPAEAAAAAQRIRRERAPERLGVRIPVQSCFRRSVELPPAARGDAGRILELDLERSTPFKLKDVYTAAYIDEGAGAGGRIKAVQLVAKRQTIDPILEELRAADLKVDFVDCWDEQGQRGPARQFPGRGRPAAHGFQPARHGPAPAGGVRGAAGGRAACADAVALPVGPGGRAGAGGRDAHAGHGRAHRAGDLERGGRRADAAAAPEARADPEHCHHRRADQACCRTASGSPTCGWRAVRWTLPGLPSPARRCCPCSSARRCSRSQR